MKKEVTIQTTPASEPKKIMVDENGGGSSLYMHCIRINAETTENGYPLYMNAVLYTSSSEVMDIMGFAKYLNDHGLSPDAMQPTLLPVGGHVVFNDDEYSFNQIGIGEYAENEYADFCFDGITNDIESKFFNTEDGNITFTDKVFPL